MMYPITRKLATIRKIAAIDAIPDADAIQVATVDGWKVVVQKGLYSTGDLVVYLEIDSWVPHQYAPFLSKGSEPRTYEGVVGERLRTVKLRGQTSQGLILPLSVHPLIAGATEDRVGEDVSGLLGIIKWEQPVPAAIAGEVEGMFPSWMRKTDQERCQNIGGQIFGPNINAKYEVSLKLDGSSMTVFARHMQSPTDPDVFGVQRGVCSRNLQLKINEANSENTLVKVAVESRLLDVIEMMAFSGRSYAVQGEIMGPGIQGNREKLTKHAFYVFDIQDLNTQQYLTPKQRQELMTELHSRGVDSKLVQHVPILGNDVTLTDLHINSVADLLYFAEGRSINNAIREGVVFKRDDGDFSFKAIANNFLIKEGN